MYWSTGIQASMSSRRNATLLVASPGEAKRKKYQHEQSHWARVSVSLRAGPPHLGHVPPATHDATAPSGLVPLG